jgi:L-alanine-DL-glutamate epimerase-like enolase superfamily enzyme
MSLSSAPKIRSANISAFTIPTESVEADGTFTWNSTTLVLVELEAAAKTGIGFTYAAAAAAPLLRDIALPLVIGADATNIPQLWQKLQSAMRNIGRPGIAAMAIAAVDNALWDLKAKLFDIPLLTLLGAARTGVEIYGSGGFTSYSIAELCDQLSAWRECGIKKMKMKVGRDVRADIERVHSARAAIGDACELFVDANGAYQRKQALAQAEQFAQARVSWFEEPVSSDDLDGLRLLRDRAPAGMAISAGEYGFDANYFLTMLRAGAVDVLQADATRCAGISGFLQAAALCEAAQIPLSSHCAPSLHVHVCCAARPVCHLEYFFDHVRVEHRFFDGALEPRDGVLSPDLTRPGLGLSFRRSDAAAFQVA